MRTGRSNKRAVASVRDGAAASASQHERTNVSEQHSHAFVLVLAPGLQVFYCFCQCPTASKKMHDKNVHMAMYKRIKQRELIEETKIHAHRCRLMASDYNKYTF